MRAEIDHQTLKSLNRIAHRRELKFREHAEEGPRHRRSEDVSRFEGRNVRKDSRKGNGTYWPD